MLAAAVAERFARESERQESEAENGEQTSHELILTDVAERDGIRALDITDAIAVTEMISGEKPDVVINCAAYTAVDRAEMQEELAQKINADGPENLARACRETGATLVHISTDYVFGGQKPTDEEYAEDDEKHPETAYGRTKLLGEEKVLATGCNCYIFRTAWLYGHAGRNFVQTMLGLGKNGVVSVVDDQHGSPTNADDLADVIYQALEKQIPFGVYNATNLGYTTWDEFTRKIYEIARVNCEVKGISSAEYEKQALERAAAKGEMDYKVAKRPLNSKMSKQKLLNAGIKIPTWEEGLKRYLDEK